MDGSLFANVPATPPPPGEKSDFTAPPPNAIALRVLATLSLAVALVAVVIRLYVKRSIKKQRLTWDDGTCLLALCAAIIHAGIFIKSLECGLGKHTWNIRAVSLTHHRLRFLTVGPIITVINMLLVRISTLGLYRRLFGVYETSKKLIIVGYFFSALMAPPEICVYVLVRRMALCTNRIGTGPICSVRDFSIAQTTLAAFGLIADTFIYSIALLRLQSLQVTRGKKIQLIIVFALGFTALSCSIANLVFVGIHFISTDVFWYCTWVSVCRFLEANIALTCTCATFLPGFWRFRIAPLSFSVFRQPSLNLFMLASTSRSRKADPSEGRAYVNALAPSSSLGSRQTSSDQDNLSFQTQYAV